MFSKLLILLLYVEVVTAEVIIAPLNAAVEVGGSVTLSYKSNITTAAPSWIFYRDRDSATATAVIAQDCQVANNSAAQYSTTRGVGGGECNLIILNATLEQGGFYFGSVGFSDRKAALLTVVDVKLSMNNRSEIVEGDELNMSCSVRRSTTQAPQQPLNLNWNAGPNISDSVNNSSLLSSGNVTAKRKVFPSYTCSISFGELKNIPSNAYATNIPSAISMRSGATDVQYCPSVPEVSYSDNRLICRADANPPATYSWVDHANGSTVLGAELKLNHSGTYTCNATTIIRGRVCYNTMDYNVTDATGKPAESSSDDNRRNAIIIIIGVVVGVGVVLIVALIITVVCCCCKKNKKTDKQKGEEDFDNMRMERTGDLNYQALNVLPTQPQETYQELKQTPVERTGSGYENQAQYENIEYL